MAQSHDVRLVTETSLFALAQVLVSTGSEARPDVPTTVAVLWIGGSTEPTNMGANDVWLSA